MRLTPDVDGRTFTVAPLPDVDPDFTVTLQDLTDSEVARIYTKHKYVPGSKDHAAYEKLVRVVKDTIRLSVKSWENLADRDGNPVECTDENKIAYLRTCVDVEGEMSTIWQLCQSAVAEQKLAAAKN